MTCRFTLLRMRAALFSLFVAGLVVVASTIAAGLGGIDVGTEDPILADVRANVDRTLTNPSLTQAAKEDALWQLLDVASKSELASRYIIESIEVGGALKNYEKAFSELQQSHGSNQKTASLLRLLGKNYVFPKDSLGLDPQVMRNNDRILQVLRQSMADTDPLVARTAVMSFTRIGPIEESRAALQEARKRGIIVPLAMIRELLITLPGGSDQSEDSQLRAVDEVIALANGSSDPTLRPQTAAFIAFNFHTEASVAGLCPRARRRLLEFEDANGPKLPLSTSEIGSAQAVATDVWITTRAILSGATDRDVPSYFLETALSSKSSDATALALVISSQSAGAMLDRARATNQLGQLQARLQVAKDRSAPGSAAQSSFAEGLAVIARHQ
jgi:hypothetical protein